MTPQEAYDEEKRINPTTFQEDLFGCFVTILYIFFAVLITCFL